MIARNRCVQVVVPGDMLEDHRVDVMGGLRGHRLPRGDKLLLRARACVQVVGDELFSVFSLFRREDRWTLVFADIVASPRHTGVLPGSPHHDGLLSGLQKRGLVCALHELALPL